MLLTRHLFHFRMVCIQCTTMKYTFFCFLAMYNDINGKNLSAKIGKCEFFSGVMRLVFISNCMKMRCKGIFMIYKLYQFLVQSLNNLANLKKSKQILKADKTIISSQTSYRSVEDTIVNYRLALLFQPLVCARLISH